MNAVNHLSIGTVAKQTGCTVPTIRYYEEIGLLPLADRSDSGQRLYGGAAARRLTVEFRRFLTLDFH
ncbi:MerR family DNA-binding transcriptional regulator [Variovorax gossypii]